MVKCVCGHPRRYHEHYRDGTDCAACADCPRYRRRWAHWSGGCLLGMFAVTGVTIVAVIFGAAIMVSVG